MVAQLNPAFTTPSSATETDIDQMLSEVENALGRLDSPEARSLSPSVPEAAIAVLGCASTLRPGPWAELGRQLRVELARERGMVVGSC